MFCLSKHLIHRLNIPIFGIHIHQGSPKSSSYLETIISNIFMHSQSSFKGINLFTSRKSRNDGENIQPYPFSNILKNMDNVFSQSSFQENPSTNIVQKPHSFLTFNQKAPQLNLIPYFSKTHQLKYSKKQYPSTG